MCSIIITLLRITTLKTILLYLHYSIIYIKLKNKHTKSTQTYNVTYSTIINYIHEYYDLHIHRKYTHIHDLHS